MAVKQIPVIDASEATQQINYNESDGGLNQIVELAGGTEAHQTTLMLGFGDAKAAPSTPMADRRSITVSHAGRGGTLHVGPNPNAGIPVSPGASVTLPAASDIELHATADPWERVNTRQFDAFLHLPLLGTLLGFIGDRCFASGDSGRSWTPWGALPPVNQAFDDSGPWDWLPAQQVTAVAVTRRFPSGELELFLTANHPRPTSVMRSRDSGRTWEVVYQQNAGVAPNTMSGTGIASDGAGTVVVTISSSGSSQGRGFLRSSESGDRGTWARHSAGAPSMAGIVHLGGSRFFALAYYATSDHLFWSNDSGVTWSKHDIVAGEAFLGAILLLDEDTAQVAGRIASPLRQRVFRVAGLTAGSLSATQVGAGTEPGDGVAHVIAKDGDSYAVLTPSRAYGSDGGNSWFEFGIPAHDRAVDIGGGHLLLSTRQGLLLSRDNGRVPVNILESR